MAVTSTPARTGTTVQSDRGCLFVWENLGPSHDDRLRACAAAGLEVTAIQFAASSSTYSWKGAADDRGGGGGDPSYRIVTLSAPGHRLRGLALTLPLLRAVWQSRARDVFLCHYSEPAVMIAALALRLFTRRRVWLMADSKYDDFPRRAWVERVKALLLRPYHGAIVASRRSAEYFAGLGVPRRRIVPGYDTLDLARLRTQGNRDAPVPAFASRAFVIVARLVPKKNIAAALRAYAAYRARGGSKRRLRILGDGPLEAELKAEAEALAIGDAVDFAGFVQTEAVSDTLRAALALLLPSVEEQFGFVVIEAMALGVPVICSRNAGAVDLMVDDGLNGFVVDPADSDAIASAMLTLDRDEGRHGAMAAAAAKAAPRGDAAHFADGVARLMTFGR